VERSLSAVRLRRVASAAKVAVKAVGVRRRVAVVRDGRMVSFRVMRVLETADPLNGAVMLRRESLVAWALSAEVAVERRGRDDGEDSGCMPEGGCGVEREFVNCCIKASVDERRSEVAGAGEGMLGAGE